MSSPAAPPSVRGSSGLCARRPLQRQSLRKAFLLSQSGPDTARYRLASPGGPWRPSQLYLHSRSCAVSDAQLTVRSPREEGVSRRC